MNADDHLISARPDWARVYRGVIHTPDGDSDLIPVTRETLRLALHALQKQNEEDYYHNYGAAANELYIVLEATKWCEQAARDEATAGDPEIGAGGSVLASIFIYPHERGEAIEQYRDWLTPEQIDEIEEAPEAALVKLAVNMGAGTSTVLIIPESDSLTSAQHASETDRRAATTRNEKPSGGQADGAADA